MIVGNKIRLIVGAIGVNAIAGPNPRRVGLLISAPNTGFMDIALGGDAGNTDGIRLVSPMSPLLIMFSEPNDWITQPISIWSSVGQTINLVEFVDRSP